MRPILRSSWMQSYPPNRIPPIVACIREHPPNTPPTLASIPQLNSLMMQRNLFSSLIRDMQETEFHHWGFVIYRCAYADQSQWDRYFEFFKAAVEDELEYRGLSSLLMKYCDWTVIHDPATLDGASKDIVRQRFAAWAAGRSAERDGPGADRPTVELMPRFRYCVYVDQGCLDTVDQYYSWVEEGSPRHIRKVVCVILDKDCDHRGRGRGGQESVEGCLRSYTGWMYAIVESIPGVYNRLSYEDLGEGDYYRPPSVWPLSKSMPLQY
ncbi:hypothetical protein F66182_6042 [Fusarium sp. NRRL 66182]|nr:hypothetical protein F66182_6042 [Fusarium sp. NRRL 66182]